MRVAIATKGYEGLNDKLSDVLARSPTITIIDVKEEEGNYCLVEIIENKAVKFSHGAGPVFANLLLEKGVKLVVGPTTGMGVEELLNELGIKFLEYKAGSKVKDVVNSLLRKK